MARINDTTTYPNTTPALADHVVGTDVSDTTNSADGEVVTFTLQAIMDALALGYNQTWQNVSGSRSKSTNYQNTTGKPIQVAITDSDSSNYEIQCSDDAATWVAVGKVGSAGTNETVTIFVVPDDHYYRINGGSGAANLWAELR